MVAKGLSNLTALALLMTLLVIIPNYGTGTIQTMQFLSVQQSQHTLSPKACKTIIISQFKRILQWSPSNFTHRLQSDPRIIPIPSFRFDSNQNYVVTLSEENSLKQTGERHDFVVQVQVQIHLRNPWFSNRTWIKQQKKNQTTLNNLFSIRPPKWKETYWVWYLSWRFFWVTFLKSRRELWDRKKMRPLLWVCS